MEPKLVRIRDFLVYAQSDLYLTTEFLNVAHQKSWMQPYKIAEDGIKECMLKLNAALGLIQAADDEDILQDSSITNDNGNNITE